MRRTLRSASWDRHRFLTSSVGGSCNVESGIVLCSTLHTQRCHALKLGHTLNKRFHELSEAVSTHAGGRIGHIDVVDVYLSVRYCPLETEQERLLCLTILTMMIAHPPAALPTPPTAPTPDHPAPRAPVPCACAPPAAPTLHATGMQRSPLPPPAAAAPRPKQPGSAHTPGLSTRVGEKRHHKP